MATRYFFLPGFLRRGPFDNTEELRLCEVTWDWRDVFVKTWLVCIGILFGSEIFYYYWVEEFRSLYDLIPASSLLLLLLHRARSNVDR